nr:hypothetical protein Muribac2_340 [uncultured Muribaculaceae bacterium]
MTYIKGKIFKATMMLLLALVSSGFYSCSKSESYSELLREEEKAVNSYLAQKKVLLDIPADSISFETGPDAPFYRLDPDGYVYMQVINIGDRNDRVKEGDKVYFRYTRENLKALYQGVAADIESNSDNLNLNDTYFVYKNTYLPSSQAWGEGVQMPLKFFGYNCEVNLIVQSYYGKPTEMSLCIPFLMNLRYFKPEY